MVHAVTFLPTALCCGTHRNAIQFSTYYETILAQMLKSGNGRTACGQPFFHPQSEKLGVFKMEVMINVRFLFRPSYS
jgi:hypothetical protein